MPYYVILSTTKYEAPSVEEVETENAVLAILNRYAGNPDFTFKVICGREIFFEPVNVATKYQRRF